MALTTIGPVRTDNIVKTEGPNNYSRDEATAPANIGPLEVGTVMARAANGTLAVLVADGGDAANCVLLEAVPEDPAARRVVVLSRMAEVALQDLRWPAGYAAADQTAAIAALRALGIVTRTGV